MSHHRENLLASFGEPDESAFARAQEILSAIRTVRSLTVRLLDIPAPPRDMGRVLEDHLEGRRLQAAEDLMRHLVGGLQHEDAVLFVGVPALSWHEGWAQWAVDPKVSIHQPGLGETYLELGNRLVEESCNMGMHKDRAAIWRARLEFALDHHDRGREILESLLIHRGPFTNQARLELAAYELERGQPLACLQHLRNAGGIPGVARLTAWSRAVLGQPNGDAKPMQSDPWPVPMFLVALRERKGDLATDLGGPPREAGFLMRSSPELLRDRGELGALVLSVHSLHDGQSYLEFADVDPAVQTDLAAWGTARRSAWRRGGDPAQEAMEEGVVAFDHRQDFKPSAALHPDTRSISVVPIVAENLELCGWLHLEWPHAPGVCVSRLERLAGPWAERMFLPSSEKPMDRDLPLPKESTETTLSDADLHAPFHELMKATDRRLGRRRWFGYVLENQEPKLVASDGKALALKGEWQGQARILARAQRLGGICTFEGADPELSIHKDSYEGLALPLKRGNLLMGFFCLEAMRPNELDEGLLSLVTEHGPATARALEAVCFGRLHRERFHRPLYLPVHIPSFANTLERVVKASTSKGPILLVGPAGCGKATLSRWGFYLRGLGVARRMDGRNFGRTEDSAEPIFLTEPEFLSRSGQALLLEMIRDGEGRKLILSTNSDPTRWKWNSDLLDAVLHCRVDVAGLRERPAEVFAWIPGLLKMHGQEEACDPPHLSKDALACLWRLPWKGGIRQLSEAMATLVIQANGIDLDLEETMDLLEPLGILREGKLPIDKRSDLALRAAAAECRTQTGRVNAAAVSRLMNWDKQTVARRLKTIGIG